MAHYRTAIEPGCLHKRGGSAKRTYNAALCNLASADLYTGINGTVVVVGVQCFFALFFSFGTALCHPQERGWQCAVCIGKNNAKSMTVANGGNAIADRRSVGFVRLSLAKAVFFLSVDRAWGMLISYFSPNL